MTTDEKYWHEIYRILELARSHAGDDLLVRCLNGRPQTAQSVSHLFKMARLHFEAGGLVRNKICEGCLPFLEVSLSFEELQRFKNPEPMKHESVLDEMKDEGRA
jgi:hypothetical protein